MADQERRRWAIAVHGGARAIDPADAEPSRVGCQRAVEAGQAVLEAGGTALKAVEAAIRLMEDDETFNAGYGSVLTAHGDVECDAAIMNGTTLDVGAVGAVQGVPHPITLAAALLPEKSVLLTGPGALRFAGEHGVQLCHPADLVAPGKQGTDVGSDTVGCVALDANGHLAAGTSTGGLAGKPPGRIGDSPLPGSGLFADDALGAVVVSGSGEAIMRVALAAQAMSALASATPERAAEAALDRLRLVDGTGGLIVLDAAGRIGWAHSSRDFAVAYADDRTPVQAFTRRDRAAGGGGAGDAAANDAGADTADDAAGDDAELPRD